MNYLKNSASLIAVLVILAALSSGMFFGITAKAQTIGSDIGAQLQATAGAQGANLGTPVDPRVTAVFIIRVLLGLTSIVLIGLNVYAGFLWMTAGGNEEQVTSAKNTIRNATIGLIIVLAAYSITRFTVSLARGYSTSGGTPLQRMLGSVFKTGQYGQ